MKLENRVAVTQGNYMKLQHVEVIVAIADAGSLRGAAIIWVNPSQL